VQRVGASDIDRINSVTLGQGVERGKEVLDGIIAGKVLGLLKAAGVNAGQLQLAGLMGGINELAGDPVGANDCETYHKSFMLHRGQSAQCSMSG